MAEGLKELYELQQIDSALQRVKKGIEALDGGAAAAKELDRHKQALAAKESDLRKLQREYQDLELQVKSLDKKRTDARFKLYGGKIHVAKELESLEREAKSLSQQIDGLETKMLGLMEAMEPLEAEVAPLRAAVSEAEAGLAKVRTEQQSHRNLLSGQHQGLLSQREAAAAKVLAPLLQRYNQVRQRTGYLGVVKVDGSTCGACHMTLPSLTLREVRESATLRSCDGCGRILYIPD
ncbi:MAG TPA: C4-type zinc ribbon domain-containing protein [Armatimonadota bacterium]|jgi:hypothetical protein